jgi:hypothetical protein
MRKPLYDQATKICSQKGLNFWQRLKLASITANMKATTRQIHVVVRWIPVTPELSSLLGKLRGTNTQRWNKSMPV